jgi:hypothetical protein
MKGKRYSQEQIIYALKRVEAGAKGGEVCRELGVSHVVELEVDTPINSAQPDFIGTAWPANLHCHETSAAPNTSTPC